MKNFLFLTLIVFIGTAIVSCNSTSKSQSASSNGTEENTSGHNQLTEDQINEGWELLFDGQSTNGWRTFNKDKAGKAWQVKDGILIFDPSASRSEKGDLITEKQYDNFHLKLDWNISDCGNSGVFFLVQEDGREKTYHTGPEMQILDNTCHNDAQYPTHRAGSLYDLIQAQPETENPAGEWNTAEIILDDGHLVFILNGTKVVETQMFDENWEEMIANSKFKDWDGFGMYRKGHIGLQDHGDVVHFRNIMIKEL